MKGSSRQAKLMHEQINKSNQWKRMLWIKIIKQKILNQENALTLLGKEGMEKVVRYTSHLSDENVDYFESIAAKLYFSYYYPGMNREIESPVNSRLNYGYAIVRSAIVRSLVSIGFHPTFGIHHNNQLNVFNLADDLIEPFRPIVDLIVYQDIKENIILTKQDRKNISRVLYLACSFNEQKIPVIHAIDLTCESLRKCYYDNDIDLLKVPKILPLEYMELITE